MEIDKIGDTMKNILSKASEGYKSVVYKVSGIKTLSDIVKNDENYLMVMYLNSKGLFKEFGKNLIYGNNVGDNSINKSIIICDKDGNEKYYINSKNIELKKKSSIDRMEVFSKDKIVGYIEVKKKIERIFTKKEKCNAYVFMENEEIVEFVKYDNSEDIDENSENWSINVNKVIGGFDLQYKKKGSGLFKKSNNVKWRNIQEEKIGDYLMEDVIILDNKENENIELMLALAANYANIPEKDDI